MPSASAACLASSQVRMSSSTPRERSGLGMFIASASSGYEGWKTSKRPPPCSRALRIAVAAPRISASAAPPRPPGLRIAAAGQGDPDAGRQMDLGFLQVERERQGSRKALCDRDRVLLALDLLAEDRELAAADAGGAVAGADDRHQAIGDLAQCVV